jgi:hypothetical protein
LATTMKFVGRSKTIKGNFCSNSKGSPKGAISGFLLGELYKSERNEQVKWERLKFIGHLPFGVGPTFCHILTGLTKFSWFTEMTGLSRSEIGSQFGASVIGSLASKLADSSVSESPLAVRVENSRFNAMSGLRAWQGVGYIPKKFNLTREVE